MRLFVGIRLPTVFVESLHARVSMMQDAPQQLRQIDSAQWHCTIAFLGEVSQEHLGTLNVLLQKVLERPPQGTFACTSIETFPIRNPTYLVARFEMSPNETWSRFVEQIRDVVSVVAPDVDRRQWLPHVSIGRAKKGTTFHAWKREIPVIEWTARELVLALSESTSQGSRYTDLHVFPFNI